MAAGKKRGGKVVTRHSEQAKAPAEQAKAPQPAAEEPNILKVRQSVRETNPAFTVVKIIAGIVIALIIGTAIAARVLGVKDQGTPGKKTQGEQCAARENECAAGHICYSFDGDHTQCMATCSPDRPCPDGFTCKSNMDQKARKGVVMRNVCVPNSRL